MKLKDKTPTEIAEKILSYNSYWWKWELTGIEIDHPGLYVDVLSEFNRLRKGI